MKELSQGQILERLCVYYHDDFLNKTIKILRPDEKYWGAGNWSNISNGQNGILPVEFAIFGYFLVTSFRIFQIYFEAEGGWFSQKRDRINVSGGAVFDDLSYPLTEKELKSRTLHETPVKQLKHVSQREEKVQRNGSTTSLMYLSCGISNGFYFNDINAGNEIYGLLVDIIHGTPNQVVQVPNLADQLEKLTDLHRNKVITDEEYRAARGRLGLD